MRTSLNLTRLECRDVPAAFNPTAYSADFEPIPGWTGQVVTTVGDFNGDGSDDTAYAAGVDGAPRVRVYSGGQIGKDPVPVTTNVGPTARPGEIVYQPPGAGDVLFDDFVFEPSFRGGADITSILRPGQSDILVFTPGVGGGPRVRLVTLDGEIDRSFWAFDDPNYRGGLYATQTTVAFEIPAEPHQFGIHLLVMPRAGGGPIVSVFDVDGTTITRFLVGPETDRREYRLLHADVNVPGPEGRRGLYVLTPDDKTIAFDWRGEQLIF